MEDGDEDIMEYARKERGIGRKEFQAKGAAEAERIKFVDADDVEGLWTIHPADLDREKRNLHLKFLKALVHTDKQNDPNQQLVDDLNAAFTSKYSMSIHFSSLMAARTLQHGEVCRQSSKEEY